MELNLIDITRTIAAGIAMGLGAIGSAVGEGYAAGSGVSAVTRQPAASGETLKLMLVGQAVAEAGGIFALLVALILLLAAPHEGAHPLLQACRFLGAGISMGVGALGPTVGQGIAASYACSAFARNPPRYALILRTMLVGQAVSETTAVYSLVVALIMIYIG